MPLPGILGGFKTLQKQFFHIFGAKEKTGKISDFFRKYRIFRQKIGDFSRFFLSKPFPCRPKTDFSPINRPKNPIFCSLIRSTTKMKAKYHSNFEEQIKVLPGLQVPVLQKLPEIRRLQ